MTPDLLAQLESLVNRLLSERLDLLRRTAELGERNAALIAERDGLLADRVRIDDELGKLVAKLDELGRS